MIFLIADFIRWIFVGMFVLSAIGFFIGGIVLLFQGEPGWWMIFFSPVAAAMAFGFIQMEVRP